MIEETGDREAAQEYLHEATVARMWGVQEWAVKVLAHRESVPMRESGGGTWGTGSRSYRRAEAEAVAARIRDGSGEPRQHEREGAGPGPYGFVAGGCLIMVLALLLLLVPGAFGIIDLPCDGCTPGTGYRGA